VKTEIETSADTLGLQTVVCVADISEVERLLKSTLRDVLIF